MGLVDLLMMILKMFMGKQNPAAIAPKNSRDGDANMTSEAREFQTRAIEAVPGDVKMISGCRDDQTSADVHDVSQFGLPASPPGAGGACTNSLLKAIKDSSDPCWMGILKQTRSILKEKRFTQVPQMSTSRSLNMTKPFEVITGPGNTKSLFIGINYVGHAQGVLNGCHNDCIAMMGYIQSQGYSSAASNMKVLMDDGKHDSPSAQNIMDGMRWLVSGAKAGDNLFMHYSGHGASMPDQNNDEDDKMDEVLCPVDYNKSGCISDDVIYDILVSQVPKDCNLTVLMDCCHSGTILDLPYVMRVDDQAIAQYEAFKKAEAEAAKQEALKVQAEALRKEEEAARRKAEEARLARLKAEQERIAKEEAEKAAAAKKQAEEEAKRKAEEIARLKAEAEAAAQNDAQEAARLEAEAKKAEAEAAAQEAARLQQEAEEQKRLEAERIAAQKLQEELEAAAAAAAVAQAESEAAAQAAAAEQAAQQQQQQQQGQQQGGPSHVAPTPSLPTPPSTMPNPSFASRIVQLGMELMVMTAQGGSKKEMRAAMMTGIASILAQQN